MTAIIIPISDLRRQVSKIVQQINNKGDVVYITQHGRPAAVLVDYQQYEAMLVQLRALIRSQKSVELQESAPVYQTDAQTSLLSSLAEMAQDLGLDDLAEQHDHYLYGTDKK